MNIYRQELRMSARSGIYWTLGMLLTLLFFMLMFPAFSQDAAIINQILSQFPKEIIKALGLSSLDLSTILGFYGYVFIFILLIAAIYALKTGISSLSEEIRAKTADFLVSKPVSRAVIVTAKIASVLTLLVLQTIVYLLGALIITRTIGGQYFDKSLFILMNMSLLGVELFFAGLGFLLAVIIKKIKTVLPLALGIVFGFWIIQMLNQSLEDPALAYLTPFAYFDIVKIIETGRYETVYLICELVLIAVFTALTYIVYQHKDMPSV